MPRFNKPVFFTNSVKQLWEFFWAGLPDETPLSIASVFAEATQVTDFSGWSFVPDDGATAWEWADIPGWAFLTVEGTGRVMVITWTLTERPVKRPVKKFKEPAPAPEPVAPPAVAYERVGEFPPEPPGLPAAERRKWLVAEQDRWSWCLGRMSRSHPDRQRVYSHMLDLQRRTREAKAAAALEDDGGSEGESAELVARGNGSYVLTPCVRYLLRKVAELEAKVNGL